VHRMGMCICILLVIAGTARAIDQTATAQAPAVHPSLICGPASLWQVARLCGKELTLSEVTSLLQTRPGQGTSVRQMVEGARRMGLEAEVLRTDPESLRKDPRMAIVFLETKDLEGVDGHFALLESAGPEVVTLVDGPTVTRVPVRDFQRWWKGIAIMVGPKPPGPPALSWTNVMALLGGTLISASSFMIVRHWVCSAWLLWRSPRRRSSV
jgi:ABC-type bacteriocin/lantibiotic exporter with double-glycine peptidase domain